MDWDYDLLSAPERAVLQRLSVFAGGWTLEAAEAICAGEGVDATEVCRPRRSPSWTSHWSWPMSAVRRRATGY